MSNDYTNKEPQTDFLKGLVAAFRATDGMAQYNVFDPARLDAVDRLNLTLSRRLDAMEEESALLRASHKSVLDEIASMTAEFLKWQEADPDAIPEQPEEVAGDHNAMLQRLISVHKIATNKP